MIKNFLIVGTQRTGSSALAEAIGLHPDVTCGWEWTQRIPWAKKIEVAKRALHGDFSVLREPDQEHMSKVFLPSKKWLGFRRLFRASRMWFAHPSISPALLADRLEDHIRWVSTRPDIHVIHVLRKDNIEWLKSKFVAKSSNTYWGNSYPTGIKVKIPIRESIARLKSKEWIDTRLSNLADTNPYLSLYYEDFLDNPTNSVHAALTFLQCDPCCVQISDTKLKRQSKGTAADYIANYEELIHALRRQDLLVEDIPPLYL